MGRFLLGSTIVVLFAFGDTIAFQPATGRRNGKSDWASRWRAWRRHPPPGPEASDARHLRRCHSRDRRRGRARRLHDERGAVARHRLRPARTSGRPGAAGRARRRVDRRHRPHGAAGANRAPLHRAAPRGLPRHRRAGYMDAEALAGVGIEVRADPGLRRHGGGRMRDGRLFAAAKGYAAMDGGMRAGRWLRSEGVAADRQDARPDRLRRHRRRDGARRAPASA